MKATFDTENGTFTIEDDAGTSVTVSLETYDEARRLVLTEPGYLAAIEEAHLLFLLEWLRLRQERLASVKEE